MATTPPRILKNFNVFANGKGFAGRVTKCELPEISVNQEDFRAGGMDTPTQIDMGLDKMTAKFTFADPDPDLLSLVALQDGSSSRLIVRGSFVRDMDNTRVAVIAELGGVFNKQSFGAFEAGKTNEQDYEMTVTYYRLEVGGVEVYEIDALNMIRRIGGVDQLAGIRSDLGL